MRREPLKAGEGKYLTNGKVHGKQIYLAEDESGNTIKNKLLLKNYDNGLWESQYTPKEIETLIRNLL